jgi:hypothetical protein
MIRKYFPLPLAGEGGVRVEGGKGGGEAFEKIFTAVRER